MRGSLFYWIIKDVLNRRYHISDVHIFIQTIVNTQPIQYLSENGELREYKNVIKLLLDYGAHPYIKNKEDETVFSIIESFNSQSWVVQKYNSSWTRAQETKREVNKLRNK